MSEPVVIDPVMQRDGWDCAVACIQMLLGASYHDVRKHIRLKNPTGLSIKQILRIAKVMGHPLACSKDVLVEDIGILSLDRSCDSSNPRAPHEGHCVMYLKGVIYNPAQGQLWTDPEAYTLAGKWTVEGILKRKD